MRYVKNKSLLFWGSLIIASCASKSGDLPEAGQSSPTLMISKIELTSDDKGSQLIIHSTKEPKYNVFKLMDPERIVIDLIDAKLDSGAPTSIPGNDIVKEVKVQSLEDSLSALVRMEIVLNKPANYLAELTSDGLSLQVSKMDENQQNIANSSAPVAVESPAPIAAESPAPLVDGPVAGAVEKPVEKSAEAPSESAGIASIPSIPIPIPVPETAPVPVPVPAPEVAAVPEVPAAPTPEMKMNEAPQKSEAQMNSQTAEPKPEAKQEVAEAPQPSLAPSAVAPKVESVPEAPIPAVVPTEKEKKVAEKKNPPEMPNLKPVQSQEIIGVATEGTSLLSELDSKIYTGHRVSLEFQDAEVQDVLRLIADVSKLNIVTGDDVKGKLSLKLIDVPWDQALDIILTTLGLDKTQHGNIIRIAPSDKLRKEREVALANDKAAKQLEPLKLQLINVNYATATDLSSRIKNLLSDRGTVDTDSRTNTLIVKDIREHLSRVEKLVKALDTQTPQVRIEARIVEATDEFTKDFGIQWGPAVQYGNSNSKKTNWQFPNSVAIGSPDLSPPTGQGMALANYAVDSLIGSANAGTMGFRLGSVSNIFDLDLKLQFLEQESLGRVVSRPSISVLDNKTASIIQGENVPFLASSVNGTTVTFQQVGISINVTPQITSDGSVILKIHTSSDEILATSVGGNPITTAREATTEMLVKSGRTAVLGGVFQTSTTISKAGTPGLYKLPFIGWLFGNDHSDLTRTETLVFVTPYILNDSRVATAVPSSESNIEH